MTASTTTVRSEAELAAEYDRMMALDASAIFVFGSNEAGYHGAGAALAALRNYGAILGQASGLQGRSYAIATKDVDLCTRSLDEIAADVIDFLDFARANPDKRFLVTRIGCGRAGYTDIEIAPMFDNAPGNVFLPEGWSPERVTRTLKQYLAAAELKLGRSVTIHEVGELAGWWQEGIALPDAVAKLRDRSGV